MKNMRVAVIGAGFVGRVHIEALRRLGNVDVCAIGARSGGEDLHVDRVERDYRTLIADKSIDAIHICTPNALRFQIAKAALEAGKHVVCEKPLAVSVAEARDLVALAKRTGLRNCTFHNLRAYPMIQQARAMVQAGELGEILVVQGTYSQDWLLYDTDWNWRIEEDKNGPSRVMADIGSHWCDGVEHVTGLRITELCADLQTFHKMRKRPKGSIETFSGKTLTSADYEEVAVNTEDFGAVLIHMGERTRGSFTASQVSAGRKNGYRLEIYGTESGLTWEQERPEELWIGHRNQPNGILLKDPSLLKPEARRYAELPGGHGEGYGDTFKQIFRRFYASVENPEMPADYPQFADGLRQLQVLDAELLSHQRRGWVTVADTN